MGQGRGWPPGWYPRVDGTVAWWDGTSWAPTAPQQPDEPRVIAIVSHASLFLLPLVLAVVLRVVGRRDPFSRHHASEALNLQIAFALVWNASLLTVMASGPQNPGLALLLIPLAMLAFAAAAVLAIIGAVRASNGLWWRYPQPLRVVPGAVRSAPSTGEGGR